MAEKLTDADIRKRLVKLRNYERLYPELKKKYEDMKQEFRMFKEETKRQMEEKDKQIETLLLQAEELKRMVFKMNRKKKDDEEGYSDPGLKKPGKVRRSPGSYRRPIPPASSLTSVEHLHISSCPDCDHALRDLKTVERYTEDMALPAQTMNRLKSTKKRCITTGYCPVCRQRKSAVPLPKHTVTLGPNIRTFVAYGSVILRLSYDQIKDFCADLVGVHISDGEISNILKQESRKLFPHFSDLLKRIRGQPGAHFDETGWKVQKGLQGNHAWVMTGTQTQEAVFLLGRSRGKGNAEELKGKENTGQVGISDDYGAYRNLFTLHQLCWSHPLRKLRDLKNSSALNKVRKEHCKKVYADFAELYADLEAILKKSFDLNKREKAGRKMMQRFEDIAGHHPDDPEKLKTIKESLLRGKEAYFTCLAISGIPADNNKAERALRHLVLKRKNSYGSKTQKGADTMNILYSVLLSLWWKRPKNFFSEYSKLLKTA